MSVERGEVFGLLGPNGAGKSTLLRLLLGFLKPTSGSAVIDGLDCVKNSVDVRKRVSYLPGDARLFRHMKAKQVLRFFAEIRGYDVHTSFDLADRLELDMRRRVAFMSTGMRQKLALAAVLSADTDLLVLDEPTANLDPNVRSEILRIVMELKQQGRTVVFSSHVLSEVEEICDRVAFLRSGNLACLQSMSDLRRQHRIRATLSDDFPVVPESLAHQVQISHRGRREVQIDTPGELAPLLGWLSTLPINQINIEPLGLRAIYDRVHHQSAANNGNVDA